MLPDMSGTEVCRRLKGNEKTKHIPIIMVTARAEEIDRSSALKSVPMTGETVQHA